MIIFRARLTFVRTLKLHSVNVLKVTEREDVLWFTNYSLLPNSKQATVISSMNIGAQALTGFCLKFLKKPSVRVWDNIEDKRTYF